MKMFNGWALALMAIPFASASADIFDGRPYLGGGLSYSVYDDVHKLASDRGDVTDQNITKNAFGFAGFAGWRFPGNYSLEVSFADFGEFEIAEYTEYSDGDFLSVDETGSISGAAIGMRYDWAETDNVNAYGRIGVMRWEAEWDTVSTRDYFGDGDCRGELEEVCVTRTSGNTDGTDFYVGIGGQYQVMRNLYLYAEGYYLDTTFDKDGFSTDQPVMALYGGLMYRFGDVARSTGTTDKRTREVTACDPKYKDVSGLMCEQ